MLHIVTFRFAGDAAGRRLLGEMFRDALVELPSVIPQLRSIKVGLNINPAEDTDLTLIAEADTLADIAAYSAHPAHQAALDIVRGKIDLRICSDIE